jgi:hypothetical protein
MIHFTVRATIVEPEKIFSGPCVISHLVIIIAKVQGNLRVLIHVFRILGFKFRKCLEGFTEAIHLVEYLGYFYFCLCSLR